MDKNKIISSAINYLLEKIVNRIKNKLFVGKIKNKKFEDKLDQMSKNKIARWKNEKTGK